MRRPTRERTLEGSCQRDMSCVEGDGSGIYVAERFDQGSSQPPASPRRQTRLSPPAGQTYRTILPWIAQETQYCSLRYILGTVYSANTEASEISPAKRGWSAKCFLGAVYAEDEGSRGARESQSWRSLIRTDSRRLDHVADGEPLDGLVLGGASRAVGAADGLDVAAAWKSRVSNARRQLAMMVFGCSHPSCYGRYSFSS